MISRSSRQRSESRARAGWLGLVACAASACAPEYHSGQLRCHRDSDCPSSWTCARARSDEPYTYCYEAPPSRSEAVRSSDDAGSGSHDAAAVDADTATPDPEAPDSGDRVDAALEAGPPAADGGGPEPPDPTPRQTAPFSVVARKPGSGETLEDPGAALTVTFSAEPDRRWVRPGVFTVTRAGREVQGELSVQGRTVSFKPKEPWVLSAGYIVTITDELRDLEQRRLEATLFDVWVRAGVWSRIPIATSTASDAYADPRIVLSNGGVAAITWTSYFVGSRHAAPATSVRAHDGMWSPMEKKDLGYVPAFVINDLGHVVLALEDEVGSGSTLLHYYSDAWALARLWSDETIEYYANGTRDVSIDAMDRVSAIRGGHDASLTAQLGSFGSRLEQSQLLPESSGALDAKVATFGDDLVALWSRVVDPDAGMGSSMWATNPARGALYCSTGCAATRLSSETAVATEPALRVDPAGRTVLAAWVETEASGSSVRAARFASADQAWSEARTVAKSAGTVSAIQLAMDERGGAGAVWLDVEGASAQVMSAVLDPQTGNWSAPESLSGVSEEVATAPAVAMERRGNALAIWTQHSVAESATGDVRWARYVVGTGWMRESSVLSVMPHAADPSVSLGMDARGRAVAAWTESETIWVAEYE